MSTRSEISPPLRSSSRTPCWRFSRHSHGVPIVRDTDRLLCGLAHLLHQRRGVGRLYIFCSQWLRSHAALFRLAADRRHASVQPFSAARAAGDRKLCFFREIVHFFGSKNITASGVDCWDSLLGANQIQGCFWEAVLGGRRPLAQPLVTWSAIAIGIAICLVVSSRILMGHSYRVIRRMRYGPGFTRERHNDRGGPSSDTA
jgi:hypothetical protein